MKRLIPIINSWLALPGNTIKRLSELTGVPERRLYAIRHEEYGNVEFTTADKLLCGMDKHDEWFNALLDVYEQED